MTDWAGYETEDIVEMARSSSVVIFNSVKKRRNVVGIEIRHKN